MHGSKGGKLPAGIEFRKVALNLSMGKLWQLVEKEVAMCNEFTVV